MTQTELQQLIERVENDLSNNWAVDADDLKKVLSILKHVNKKNPVKRFELYDFWDKNGLSIKVYALEAYCVIMFIFILYLVFYHISL